MDLGIEGKCALVLASSQGLGFGVAKQLASEGARVVLTGRNADRLSDAVAEINALFPGTAAHVVADLGDVDTPARLLKEASTVFGPVDILVINSGGPAPAPASRVSLDTWNAEFAKMVTPLFEIVRLAVDGMRQRKWGRIVALASSGVVQPIPHLAVSNALRASLTSWLKTLSFEVAVDGVTVNVVAPGRIATQRVAQLDQATAERTGGTVGDVQKASIATIPTGRYGTVEEFSSVVAFLVSQQCSYVTGSIVRVDGGMIKSL